MGLPANIAKALAKKVFVSSTSTCPKSPSGRHHWTKWMNEEHPNTGVVHGPRGHVIFYCSVCGGQRK